MTIGFQANRRRIDRVCWNKSVFRAWFKYTPSYIIQYGTYNECFFEVCQTVREGISVEINSPFLEIR